jgi:hypothetical protein
MLRKELLAVDKHRLELDAPLIGVDPVVMLRDLKVVLLGISQSLSNKNGRTHVANNPRGRELRLIVRVDVKPGGPASPVGRGVARRGSLHELTPGRNTLPRSQLSTKVLRQWRRGCGTQSCEQEAAEAAKKRSPHCQVGMAA